MNYKTPLGKAGMKLSLLSGLVLILMLVLVGIRFKSSNPDLENRVRNMIKKEETLTRMRISLLKSADIEKSAVMADTDEQSKAFAEESMRTAEAVERDRRELTRLIEPEHIDKEMSLLREFDDCWDELRKVDKVLLDFAIENSNIKASVLSFTQGSQAINRFKKILNEIVSNNSSGDHYSQVLKLASDALIAGLQTHYLHAPHIAAANDKEMDRIEMEISQLNEMVHNSLDELKRYLPEDNQPLLKEASSAFAEFNNVTAVVLRLSRQNTNIKSFELSLGRKRKITAQCDEILNNMLEVFRSRAFEATR